MSADRRGLLAKIHVAKKQLALADDSYRDILRRIAGVASAGDADIPALERVLAEFKRLGFSDVRRRRAVTSSQALIKALWLALHNLGAVRSGSDAALEAFVRRQAGVSALRFVGPAQQGAIVQALRNWLRREGLDNQRGDDPVGTRLRLVRRQWAKLDELGQLWSADGRALEQHLAKRGILGSAAGVEQLDADRLDRAAADLGRWLRAVRKPARDEVAP